ncbi:V-set domain-containing T-cell activation inhibitor 1 isoform X2 [Xyrauchen texanus]|uniref:V-set domain-containing T-cell activation inhibitor 1 isoform X2 n=1 Tax=Xyrauchen texanus TaxID=154827 RepID=UPI0022428941|nr:V-set domain-containing T-cell activation inhibitor 1 isoform X2 [Xyrauchen texanus]
MERVSLQETVEGFIGSSAVLPCHSGNKKLQVITVYWRYKDIKNVYDIQDGKGSVKEQDVAFKGRTATFPMEYVKGNFSLSLGSLQQTDAGTYCCFIPVIDHHQCTELQIKERPRELHEQYKPSSRNNGVEAKAEKIVSLFIPFFSITIMRCI